MNDEAIHPDQLTIEQYAIAFQTIEERISKRQRQMLAAHFAATDRTVSSRQLAKAVGLVNHSAANLQYGALAQRLCSVLGRHSGSDAVFILASFVAPHERNNTEWLWIMRPQVAEALLRLGWVMALHAVPSDFSPS